MEIKVALIHENAQMPIYSSDQASGADIRCVENFVLHGKEKAVIKTGLVIELPDGFEAQIRPRSGLAAKNGVTVLNTPGTIDSDYRGEIGVILINHSTSQVEFEAGDRIAQMVIAPVTRADFTQAEYGTRDFSETERGSGGFGSTGKE